MLYAKFRCANPDGLWTVFCKLDPDSYERKTLRCTRLYVQMYSFTLEFLDKLQLSDWFFSEWGYSEFICSADWLLPDRHTWEVSGLLTSATILRIQYKGIYDIETTSSE